MDSDLLKTGGCSIVLGKNHYSGYFSPKIDKLFKVTRLTANHNELNNIEKIRSITNYEKYFVIPDKQIFEIKPEDRFYKFLQQLIENQEDKPIITGNPILYGSYITFGGKMDLHDSIVQMDLHCTSKIWTGPSSILNFCNQIMNALAALHDVNICHLDIKPENIMVSLPGPVFKIIDFGFSSQYPFNDFIVNFRGTPGYFPKHCPNFSVQTLPPVDATDFIPTMGNIPLINNRNLVYKIDTYCFGRTLLFLYNFYQANIIPSCSCFNGCRKRKIERILKLCLESNVLYRPSIGTILALNIL
jgi:serine/threonine protein kinase